MESPSFIFFRIVITIELLLKDVAVANINAANGFLDNLDLGTLLLFGSICPLVIFLQWSYDLFLLTQGLLSFTYSLRRPLTIIITERSTVGAAAAC